MDTTDKFIIKRKEGNSYDVDLGRDRMKRPIIGPSCSFVKNTSSKNVTKETLDELFKGYSKWNDKYSRLRGEASKGLNLLRKKRQSSKGLEFPSSLIGLDPFPGGFIPGEFTCTYYAGKLHDYVESNGVRCASVSIDTIDEKEEEYKHALVAFNTLDKGLIFVDNSKLGISYANVKKGEVYTLRGPNAYYNIGEITRVVINWDFTPRVTKEEWIPSLRKKVLVMEGGWSAHDLDMATIAWYGKELE